MTFNHPPDFLLDLYGITQSSHPHPSLFYPDRDEASFPTPSASSTLRPYVTLTFAQSLDAKIAGAGGRQLILSGKESMVMTHWMRTLHDAILVGIGTALNDDPQLNTRHLPPLPSDCPYGYRSPRPVILDKDLRLPVQCKLLRNHQAGQGRRPWVVCGPAPASSASQDSADAGAFAQRAAALEAAGARIIPVRADQTNGGRVSLDGLLSALRTLGVRSLMVEGGARVIRSFLSDAHRGEKPGGAGPPRGPDGSGEEKMKLVDALVITVAPTLVGEAGVGYGGGDGSSAENLPTFEHVRTESFGPDSVVAVRVL